MEAVLLAVEVAAPVRHQGGGVVPLQPGHEGSELRHDGGRQQQLVRQARLHHVGPGGAWHGGDCTKTTSTLHGDTWQGGRELGGQVEARGGRQLLGLGAKESSTEKKMSTIIGLSMDISNILTWKDDVEPVYESVHSRLLHGRQGPAPRLAALCHAVQRLCTVLLSGGERGK